MQTELAHVLRARTGPLHVHAWACAFVSCCACTNRRTRLVGLLFIEPMRSVQASHRPRSTQHFLRLCKPATSLTPIWTVTHACIDGPACAFRAYTFTMAGAFYIDQQRMRARRAGRVANKQVVP